MRNTEQVIEDSGVSVGYRPQNGGFVHEDWKAILAGAGSVGAGVTVGCGPTAGAQRRHGETH